jgi:hypothetical protein
MERGVLVNAKGTPGLSANDAVDVQMVARLEMAHSPLRFRSEGAVHLHSERFLEANDRVCGVLARALLSRGGRWLGGCDRGDGLCCGYRRGGDGGRPRGDGRAGLGADDTVHLKPVACLEGSHGCIGV